MLYNKYRPREFQDVIGQPATQVLRNLTFHPRVQTHSILLSGTRGVGKTTLARIFARALNCSGKGPHKPCWKCESCLRRHHPDILEIDSAMQSNTSDLQNLQERMSLMPEYTHRVYIFDEAQTLTKKSMGILLKAVEEPAISTRVLFLTTEPDKIDPALRSRCMWLQLKPLEKIEIIRLLAKVATKERIKVSKEAIFRIADYAAGSARDALSLLETVQHYPRVTSREVEILVGHRVDTAQLLENVMADDLTATLKEIERLCIIYDATLVLKSLISDTSKYMVGQVLEGKVREGHKMLLFLEALRRAKNEFYFPQRPQLLVEIAIFDYWWSKTKSPTASGGTSSSISVSAKELDWSAFIQSLEDKRLRGLAKELRFIRLKRDSIAVCKRISDKQSLGKTDLSSLAKGLTKFFNRKMELEIL